MGLADRYRRLPYLEPSKQKFLALELVSVIIISAGCMTLLLALVYETSQGGMDEAVVYRILSILSGFFMMIIGLVILLVFMYRHVSALEQKLNDLKAPEQPVSEDVVEASKYVEEKQREAEKARQRAMPSEEEKRRQKVAEAEELAKRIKALEDNFQDEHLETPYQTCPFCGENFAEDWDTCPKCDARLR